MGYPIEQPRHLKWEESDPHDGDTQPMGDGQQYFATAQLGDRLLDVALVVRVHTGGGFITDDDRHVLQEAAGCNA